MVDDIDLESWLSERSDKVERVGKELLFTHPGGSSSILILRDAWLDGELQVGADSLKPFYRKYHGASIGDSQLMIGSNVRGGLVVSQGFTLPDLGAMHEAVLDLGMMIDDFEEVFMIEAAWMFSYSCSKSADSVWRRHDRDFGKVRVIKSLRSIFDDWWQMVTDESV